MNVFEGDFSENFSLEKKLNMKFLASCDDKFRRYICEKAQITIAYTGKISSEIEEAKFFVFNYGYGVKEEYFAVRCSDNSDLFFHINLLNRKGLKINYILVKINTIIDKPGERSLFSIIV